MKSVIEDHVGCSVALPDPTNKDQVIEHLEPVFIQMETYIHGKTSGGDIKTVVRGGFLRIDPQSIVSLQSPSQFRLILVDSGVRAKTSMAVAKVRGKVEDGSGTPILQQIGAITEEICLLLNEQGFESSPAFISKISTNHELLTDLGLNIDQIDDIVGTFTSFSIPAKISGKGCGGIVVGIMEDDENLVQKICSELSTKGYSVYTPSLDQHGISCVFHD